MAEKKPTKKTKKTEDAPVEETIIDATAEAQPEAEPEAAAEEAPVEEPVVEEPVAEAQPEAAAEVPVVEAEPEVVVEEPVAEEPVAEETVAEAEPEAAPEEAPVEEPVVEEPVAEVEPPAAEAPAAKPAAEAPVPVPAPAPQSGPKPKRKHLPRALRPSTKKGRVKREKATERKPIVRIPKPEGEFGRRQERQGTVVSDKGDKTIVVKVDTIKAHPRYKKVVRRSKRFHAHDEQNAAKIGDVVRIIETRPVSKTKNWRLAEIVEAAR
jgi:small subunit ribosomal protein S17